MAGISFEREQYPVTLAWAVTIDKVQGLSLDRAAIDLGQVVCLHSQAFVASSRVRTRKVARWLV